MPATPERIVSMDFCADQYVLQLADRDQILALSPDSTQDFAYLNKEAEGIATVRATAEEVLTLQPDLVVRSYGGGPNITQVLKAAGIPVLQVGWASSVDGESVGSIPSVIQTMADGLGVPERGQELIRVYRQRLADLPKVEAESSTNVLYLTPAGSTTGSGSMIHDVLTRAGLTNFESTAGWREVELERLAYETPDVIAASFFDTTLKDVARWSSSRHPIIKRQLDDSKTVQLPGAWTTCGAWFIVDAIEALAEKRASLQ